MMDIIAPVPEKLLAEQDIIKGGMTLVDEKRALAIHRALKKSAKTTQVSVQEVAGGSAANTMAGIAALGLRAAYISKVADDALGQRFRAGLHEAGLFYETPPTTSGPATARCMIAVTPDGERSMSTFLGATTQIRRADVVRKHIEAASILYLEGYLFDKPTAKAALEKAASIAVAAGRKVALTLSDDFCVHQHRDDFNRLVDNHVDILFANETELLSLTQKDDFEAALESLKNRCETACITRSEKGSVILNGNTRYDIPASPVDNVVDTTGAGDQYAAGVLTGHALGLAWPDCGWLGSLSAAEVISHYGARPITSIHKIAIGA